MSIFRSLIAYAPAVALPRMVSLLLMLMLTRLMSRAEYGQFVLVVTVGEAIDAFCCNWVRIAYMRFASACQGDLGRETVRSGWLMGGTFLIAVAVSGVTANLIRTENALDFALAVLAYMGAISLQRIPNMMMSIRDDRNGLMIMEFCRAVGILALGLLVAWRSDSFFLQAMATSTATAAAGLWGCRRCLRSIAWRSGPLVPMADYLGYGLVLIPGALVAAAFASMDRIVLDRLQGAEVVAIYAAAVMLARQPLDFLFSLAGTRAFTLLIEDYESKGQEQAQKRLSELVSSVAFLTLPAAIGLALVADPLANLLLAPVYRESASLLIPIMVVTALFAGFKTFIFEQIFHMVKRNGVDLIVTLPALVIGLLAQIFLTRTWGLWGCALGVLVQYATLLASSMFVARRFFEFKLPLGDLWRIAMACLTMTAGVMLMNPWLLGGPDLVRLIVSAVTGALIYGASVLLLKPSPVLEVLPHGLPWFKKN